MFGVIVVNGKLLVAAITYLAILFSIISIHFLTTRQRQLMLGRLSLLNRTQGKQQDVRQIKLDAPFFERIIHPILERLAKLTKKILPAEKEAALQRKLLMAGHPGQMSSNEFLVFQYGLAVILAIVAVTVAITFFNMLQFQVILMGLGAGISGNILPVLFLNRRIAKHKENIQQELPDILDLLTISVDAGLGFDAALLKVVEKKGGALGAEFFQMLQEVKKGKARRDALRDMAKRCQVNDLSTFVGAIVQADQLGVSISNVLRLQAEQMRQRRRQQAEEQAMKAPVKMLFPLIFFIFPTIFIVLLGPAVIQVYEVLVKK